MQRIAANEHYENDFTIREYNTRRGIVVVICQIIHLNLLPRKQEYPVPLFLTGSTWFVYHSHYIVFQYRSHVTPYILQNTCVGQCYCIMAHYRPHI